MAGMTPEERLRAASGHPGWDAPTRAFASNAQGFQFEDSAGLMRLRFGERWAKANGHGATAPSMSAADVAALMVMGLGAEATRSAVRARYAELVRRYHPDRNGGDRAHEARLQAVIDAYTQLRRSPAFAD
jgi:DnaJ-domain-containing protein 1